MDAIERRAVSDLQTIVDRWDADPFAAMGYDVSQERRVIRECLALVKRLSTITPVEDYVPAQVARGAMYVCPTCHGVGSVTQQVHDQMLSTSTEVP